MLDHTDTNLQTGNFEKPGLRQLRQRALDTGPAQDIYKRSRLIACRMAQFLLGGHELEQLIDRQLVVRRKLRALAGTKPAADFLLSHAVAELEDRLSFIERRFAHAMTLFESSGLASAMLAASGKVEKVTRIEADQGLLAGGDGLVEPGETVPLPAASVDLAVSLLALHAFNDLPGMLIQIRRALRPDGLFIGALPGAGSLQELRQSLLAAESAHSEGAAPRVYPFADVRAVGALLQRAGFALPVVDVETLTVRYDSMFSLIADLRAMGETSALAARSRRPIRRKVLLSAAEHYAENFGAKDGRIPATFNIVWLSGWAPHSSQQKPLKPGSARMPLAKALSGIEPLLPE